MAQRKTYKFNAIQYRALLRLLSVLYCRGEKSDYEKLFKTLDIDKVNNFSLTTMEDFHYRFIKFLEEGK